MTSGPTMTVQTTNASLRAPKLRATGGMRRVNFTMDTHIVLGKEHDLSFCSHATTTRRARPQDPNGGRHEMAWLCWTIGLKAAH